MTPLSRRELLHLFLGAPVAAACRGARAPELAFPGEIAGGPDRAGHLLREGALPSPARRSRTGVLVVGAGIAGLSAAWRLARAGVEDFRVLEVDSAPGGTARGGAGPVSPFPWGAHYLPCPLPHARAALALVEEMGACTLAADGTPTFDEAQLVRAPQERLFVADRWYEGIYPHVGASGADLAELQRFRDEVARLSALRDGRGRKAFAVPRAHGSDDADFAALDRRSMAEWLAERGYGSPRLRWWIEYGCRDDYATSLETTSAWAALHYHACRSWTGGQEDLLTWPEGNAHVAAHLARRAGARLETGTVVLRVEPRARGAEVLAWRPATGAERISADHVVLAVPRKLAARLLPGAGLAPGAAEFESGAWLTANVTLRRRPRARGFPEAWDNVLFGSRSLGYVVATHQADRHGGPPGATVWTWYLSLHDRDERTAQRWLEALTWREAAELVVADLRRAHPDIAECVERLDVWRWGHAMVRPRPGFAFSRARREAARPVGDVHFAHSDLSGLPLLEEAQWQGIRAAEEILARRGVASASML